MEMRTKKCVYMARKRYSVEQTLSKLREAEVALAQGSSAAEVCQSIGVSGQTYYRWLKEYGGFRMDQARRFNELDRENVRLKKLVADQALDIAIFKEAASGNSQARRDGEKPWRGSAARWACHRDGRAGRWARPGRRNDMSQRFATTSQCSGLPSAGTIRTGNSTCLCYVKGC
jgi:putative transposase